MADIYDLTLSDLGTLALLNFTVQVAVAISFSKFVDKIGFRPLMVFAMSVAAVGLIFYALIPFTFENNIFLGLILATMFFSVAGGFFQILLSPIVNAIPSENKEAAMAKLHSYYAWGQIFTVLFATLMLFIITNFIGDSYWFIIPLILCAVPLVGVILFIHVPLLKPVTEKEQLSIKKVAFTKFFIFALIFILFCGAAEITISQWASTYLEDVVQTDKLVGDILGVCMFSLMLGIGRVLYAKFSNKLNLSSLMLIGCAACFVCYLIIAVSPVAVLSIIAFGICGLAVSLLWPGILNLTSEKFKKAGSWTLAVLAAVGNIGSAIGPFILGQVGEALPDLAFVKNLANNLSMEPSELGLRMAVLICMIFPLISFLSLLYIHKKRQKKLKSDNGAEENLETEGNITETL
ncbi:MAG: MFS transporter [Firmicutes bacterium]|nr:MFS transporter [Bacillota bacterium]